MKLPPPAARSRGVLRAAIVLRQRRQHRAALVLTVGAADAARAQPFEAGGDLVQIAAHLLDLGVHRTAFLRLAVEQREEARAFAAHPLGLHGDAVEFGLLLGGGVLVTADLLVLGGIAAPAPRSMVASWPSSRMHIGLACGVPGCGAACGGCCGGGAPWLICADAGALTATRPSSMAPVRIRREKRGVSYFEHIRPLRGSARLESQGRGHGGTVRPRPHHIPASRGSVTSFPGRGCGNLSFATP